MNKQIFILALTLIGIKAFPQTDTIYAEMKIKMLSFEGDTLKFDQPKIVSLEKYGTSEIISLGILKGQEIGLQFEMTRGMLGNKNMMINGYAFFLKHEGEWRIGDRAQYQYSAHKIISDKSHIRTRDAQHCSSSSLIEKDKHIGIQYNDRYYMIKAANVITSKFNLIDQKIETVAEKFDPSFALDSGEYTIKGVTVATEKTELRKIIWFDGEFVKGISIHPDFENGMDSPTWSFTAIASLLQHDTADAPSWEKSLMQNVSLDTIEKNIDRLLSEALENLHAIKKEDLKYKDHEKKQL